MDGVRRARCCCSAPRAGSILYVILRTQRIHPFNPQGFTHSGPWDLSFNTASSFVSNTSWQYYAGETTLSDFSQMAGITVASFTSMATGMAVAAAVIRGLARRGTDRLGNFWVDLIRSLLYIVSAARGRWRRSCSWPPGFRRRSGTT